MFVLEQIGLSFMKYSLGSSISLNYWWKLIWLVIMSFFLFWINSDKFYDAWRFYVDLKFTIFLLGYNV